MRGQRKSWGALLETLPIAEEGYPYFGSTELIVGDWLPINLKFIHLNVNLVEKTLFKLMSC